MKNIFTSLILIFTITLSVQAQFSEDFESGIASWTIVNADDNVGSWIVGDAATHSSQFWNPPAHTTFIGVNDDGPGANNNTSGIIFSGDIDLSGSMNPILSFAGYFTNGDYGADEVATALVSNDGGATWTTVIDLPGDADWQTYNVPLTDYVGQTIRIAFEYSDGGGWNYGYSVDDVSIMEGLVLDADLTKVDSKPFGEVGAPNTIGGEVFNNGGTTITSLDVSYSVGGQAPVSATISGLSIAPFAEAKFKHPTDWIPTAEGTFNIVVTIDAVNGSADQDMLNNELDFDVEIFPLVVSPNKIDMFAAFLPEFTEIGNSSDQLDRPTDLDFFPILAKRELWVINERIESSGGSTVTFYDAGMPGQDSEQKVDGNAWHFMSLPTALAFSPDNGNWASTTGVQDANHNGGTFTGPTLWSSDPAIYAQPSGGNGSHLDMLHGSPHSMGIAHEVDNAFWVFDGYNEHIVRYDFVDDHGPGNDYHADAIVRRFTDVQVKRDSPVPSHLILDKSTGWLYIVDNGNDRVMRIDINSATMAGNLNPINEPLAEHSEWTGATREVIISAGLDRPSGIDIIENRLLVSDYANGDIIVYDVDNDFVELNRIQTGEPGITGIKIGPDGNIWYTNRLTNTIKMVSPSDVSGVSDLEDLFPVTLTPNPTNGQVTINIPGLFENNLKYQVLSATGQLLTAGEIVSNYQEVDLSVYQNGMYFVRIFTETHATTKRVVLTK